jgi:thiamine pyrophosphate-dependent acetolactate synthase large subunit-like protein
MFKDALRHYIDRGISRRQFVSALSAAGFSALSARTVADEFTPFVSRPGDEAAPLPEWARPATGSGGELLVEQLAAARQRYLFINPSSGEAPVYDALVDRPGMQIIQAVHEGALTAMADGYARATGHTAFVMCARPGLPNAMTQMFNAWKDSIPLLVLVDDVAVDVLGQDGFEAMDHMDSMTAPMTKWHWSVETTERIPEVARRALKFAGTQPRGPVFLACPDNLLRQRATSTIFEQDKFDIAPRLPPEPELVRAAARLLLNAENPLILAGNEVRYHGAESELRELAELLGIPVAKSMLATWCKPFPTDHPLFVGSYQVPSRFPGKVDVLLNLGSRMPYFTGSRLRLESQTKLIQVRIDPMSLGRVYPTEVAMVADTQSALVALIEEIRRTAKARTLSRLASDRTDRARQYQVERAASLDGIARRRWDRAPISGERLVVELEAVLDPESVIVSENDTYQIAIDSFMTFGPGRKDYFTNGGLALGWGLPAAFGVQLAMPDRPVVALISDGAFLFSGPQPLWSYSRYRAPVLVLVLNNRSYNAERARIMMGRGRSYEVGRDMVCYLGDPDIDFVRLGQGFGVDGEAVAEPDDLKSALARGMRATREGRPYLLDVHMERSGSLATSTWHPEFSIAALRSGSS